MCLSLSKTRRDQFQRRNKTHRARVVCGTTRPPQVGAGPVLVLCHELLAANLSSHFRPSLSWFLGPSGSSVSPKPCLRGSELGNGSKTDALRRTPPTVRLMNSPWFPNQSGSSKQSNFRQYKIYAWC